ncbi:MAG: hypothetical protein K0Q66_2212 [Chitinophagaceae bacterium]|jgi:thiol:disulfide interchange protein DsbD|nr:hypothetical protein [Chitinophagaceae bacterium]
MTRKAFTLLTFLVSFCTASFAQELKPVEWSFSSRQADSVTYEIIASAKIAKGWFMYGVNPGVEGLDQAGFNFDYEGVVKQGNAAYSGNDSVINDQIFGAKAQVFGGSIQIKQLIRFSGPVPPSLTGSVECYIVKGEEFLTESTNFDLQLGSAIQSGNRVLLSSIDLTKPLAPCGDASIQQKSLWGIFLLGFIGGLIALLTPCVFPMIPVTVSFFTKRAPSKAKGKKNAILYGFFIFLIYLAASLPFHLFGVQPEALNNISTNAPLNIVFFAVFILFAISFFGYFELTLPGNLATKTDSKAGLTSTGGIFFMALTLVIVSFSCTGVILGSLLVGALTQGPWPITVGFAGFGAALALPFALFAFFPTWLSSLPKSGSWLDTVKKTLAFVEVAVALKFLSNADLVMHWGLLKREVFIATWIIVALGLSAYLFGWLRLPHDDRSQRPGAIRKLLAALTLLFALYMVPGLTQTKYANLRLLSGILPPLSYSIYGKDNVHGKGVEPNVVNDYEKALQLSKAQQKPLLIDFTGWACQNCRRMEEGVWTQPEVKDFITNNFILVSLYVDDRDKLPVAERITYTTKDGQKKNFKTIGDKWATFQAENFNQVTQPLYVVLDYKERLATHPVGYTPDWREYLAWLQCSKDAFDANK